MKLGSKSSNSLRIRTQLLKRLQRVIVVDGATQFLKGVEGNGDSLKDGADLFVLFLCSAQMKVSWLLLMIAAQITTPFLAISRHFHAIFELLKLFNTYRLSVHVVQLP